MARRKFGWHSGSLTCYDVTVENDLTIDGSMTFGDASTDTLTVNGTATFNTDVDMSFAASENLSVAHSAVTENVKVIDVDSAITDATHGARQGSLFLGVERTTAMTGSDGNPDAGLKMQLKNTTDSEAYCRLRGMDLSIETKESGSKSFYMEGISVTVKDYSGTEVDDSGHMIAGKFHTNKNGSGTHDVIGLQVQDDSQATAGGITFYGFKLASANYNITRDYALYVGSTNGSWTNALSLSGTVTNVLDFADTDGTNGFTTGTFTNDVVSTNPDAYIQIDGDGTSYYVPAYSTEPSS